jgi:OOP family OmpA-OmpF porin
MKKLIAALIAASASMSAAHAQTIQTGLQYYLGLGIATATHSYSKEGVTVFNKDGYKGNVKVFGGYEITPVWAIEVGYIDFANAGFNYDVGGVFGHGTSDGNAYYLAGKGQFPIGDRAVVYAKLGAERSRRNLKDVGFLNQGDSADGLYASIGLKFNVTPQIGLLAEYERYGKTKDFGAKADVWTIGASYSF